LDTLLAEVAAKPGVTRLGGTWIMQRCKNDINDSTRWGKVVAKLEEVGEDAQLEVPANTARQPSIYDLLNVAGVRVIKSSGYALPDTNQKRHQFEDALYLLQPSAGFTLFRQRNNRYEGPDKKYALFQGKFVTDHIAPGEQGALAKVTNRAARGETPAIQTMIAADDAFQAFNNQVRDLRQKGFFDRVFTYLTKEKGPALLAKGHQISTVLFTSPQVNVWLYDYNAVNQTYTLRANNPNNQWQKIIVYGMTMDTGTSRLVYHLERMLDPGTVLTSSNWMEKLVEPDKVLRGLQKGAKDQIIALLGNPGPVTQIYVEYQRPA
jgi:hypothetical protein